jgi:small-conductance mechanosensitive channel
MKYLDLNFFGNPLSHWALGILFAALGVVILRVVTQWAKRHLQKETSASEMTKSRFIPHFLIERALAKISWPLIVAVALYGFTIPLELNAKWSNIFENLSVTLILVQLAIWIAAIGRLALNSYFTPGTQNAGSAALAISLFVLQTLIWVITLILILDNLGINVSGLLAGLGIGGVAVALAVQNILGDLFSSLSIVLDKPFEVGDFIVAGDFMGSVEKIGIKTTRLRSISGEQIVLSNSDLLSSRIRNFKRMQERRVVFSFGITYQTPASQIQHITEQLRGIISQEPQTRFDRAHFKSFDDSALTFEVVYFIANPDFNLYMDIQQRININIMHLFSESNIAFAFPSRTLYVESLPTNPQERSAHE